MDNDFVCSKCGGSGEIAVQDANAYFGAYEGTCPQCKGSGRLQIEVPCELRNTSRCADLLEDSKCACVDGYRPLTSEEIEALLKSIRVYEDRGLASKEKHIESLLEHVMRDEVLFNNQPVRLSPKESE
jgi:hypothetical protein